MFDENETKPKEDVLGIPGQMYRDEFPTFTKIHYKVFNLLNDEDRDELEEIQNGCLASKYRIVNEIGRFFEEGSYRIMVKWSEIEFKKHRMIPHGDQ